MSVEVAVKLASDRVRDTADNYPTPRGYCRAALDLLPFSFKPRDILDPGAGLGPWGEVARERYPHANITGIELRTDVPANAAYDSWFQGSFLKLKTPVSPIGPFKDGKAMERAFAQYEFDLWASQQPLWAENRTFDLIIGNPPYKHAQRFAELAMALLAPGGHLTFLLRLAFLEGQGRAKSIWRDMPPHTVAVATRRPSFTGNGKTDATAYAQFHFVKGHRGMTNLTWLDWDYEEGEIDERNNVADIPQGIGAGSLRSDPQEIEYRAAA